MHEEGVVIAGGGIAGPTLAVFLARLGYRVDLFEKRADPRTNDRMDGRSINLALSTRGLAALDDLGIKRQVLEQAVPMEGRMIHSSAGRQSFQPYDSRGGNVINSFPRAVLASSLIEAAEREESIRMHFETTVEGVDLDEGCLALRGPEGRRSTFRAEVIIGADSAFSTVRAHMLNRDRFEFQQRFLSYGYKELTIPAGTGGRHVFEPNALHIWPRGGFMLIALPNLDGSFTATLFLPFAGEPGFDGLETPGQVTALFEDTFADALAVMPNVCEDYFSHPTSSLITVRCWPWHAGRALLIGDACHAVVPFYGQGANAALEDCLVLAECLRRLGGDWERVFPEFSRQRKPDTDALADLSMANFHEMRDRVTSRVFRVEKWLQGQLYALLPGWYTPLYLMVTFSRTPYAEAVSRSHRQRRRLAVIVTGLLAAVALLVWRWLSG